MTRLKWYYSWFLPIFDLTINFKNFHKLEAYDKVKEASLYIAFNWQCLALFQSALKNVHRSFFGT